MAAGGEFVEGWLVAQVLGEGAYGEVRLLVHGRSGATVALKTLRGEGGAREAALHRALRHPNVLRCLGQRAHAHAHYLFLEYAQGGELFDRIEPDAGMAEAAARRYWRQLLAGLQYLHGRGVAHRDIKPENLLLDSNDLLKISDFGMATVYRHGGNERLLSRVCGTLPYAAPEVLRAPERPYRAAPADLWAAALVLLAMLAGELPWERASETEDRYALWREWTAGARSGPLPRGPWRKLSVAALALLRRALHPDPEIRPTLDQLLQMPWTKEPDINTDANDGTRRSWCSQPAPRASRLDTTGDVTDGTSGELSGADMDALLSFSQPALADDLLLASPPDANLTHLSQGGMWQRLAVRMTRVWLRCDEGAGVTALCDALRKLRFTWRRLQPRLFAIECDADVRMRAWVVRVAAEGNGDGPRVLIECRRWRGCGLQFKRRFLLLRDALQPLAVPPPPLPRPLDNTINVGRQLEPMDET